ncbi:MAG: hypothetical protein DRN91_03400, partial [Candidatus Alkanophagales archaeon]
MGELGEGEGKSLNTLNAYYFQAQVSPVQGKCATRQETSRFEEGEMGGSGAREPPDPSRGGVFIWGKPLVLTG